MTGPCNRRTLLRTGALAVAGLSGCVGGDAEDPRASETTMSQTTTDTASTTESKTTKATTTEAAEPPLAVEDVRVQSSLFYLTTPDSAAVDAPKGTQFVFADLRKTESSVLPPASDDIALVADDRRFEGTFRPGRVGDPWALSQQGPLYDPDDRRTGWIAFEVPDPLEAEEVALSYESEGRQFAESLDAGTVEALAEPPAEFELVAFDFPDSVEVNESFEVSVVVESTSDVDGVFRAVLNQTSPLYAPYSIEIEVPAGERREWSKTSSWHVHDDDCAEFTLLAPGEKREATVEISSETTDEP